MRSEISKQTKHELLEVLRQRFQQAPKLEKTTILDEFVAIEASQACYSTARRS